MTEQTSENPARALGERLRRMAESRRLRPYLHVALVQAVTRQRALTWLASPFGSTLRLAGCGCALPEPGVVEVKHTWRESYAR